MARSSDTLIQPRVSTVIPCYNGEAYLAEAIASVLEQGHERLEIIVADDGSTDRSVEIASGFADPVHCLALPHAGASTARNRGVERARGDLLAFLDADDLWTAGRLRRQLEVLEFRPAVDLVMGRTVQFVSPEIPESERGAFRFDPAPVAARLSGALLVRKAAFERVGGFSPHLETGEFMDWYLRAEALGLEAVMLPEVVLRRRLHGANHGVVRRDARQDYVNVIKAALDRRRASKGTA